MEMRFFIMLCVGILAVAMIHMPVPQIHTGSSEAMEAELALAYDALERKDAQLRTNQRLLSTLESVPSRRPDGYMTATQCRELPLGEDLRDVLWRYGWPAGEDGTDSYAGLLDFPLREDHDRKCEIDFWRGEVEGKELEVQDGMTYEMRREP